MQSLLVICALGLAFLLPGCAVQDLPFSGPSSVEDGAASPYTPQAGAVNDGQSGSVQYYGQGAQGTAPGTSQYRPATPAQPAYAAPPPGMPGGPANNPPAGTTVEGAQSAQGSNTAAKPKPVTRSASGLQEREL